MKILLVMIKIIISIIINKFDKLRVYSYIYKKLLLVQNRIDLYLKVPNKIFFKLVDIIVLKVTFFYFKTLYIFDLFLEFIRLSIKKTFRDLIIFKKYLIYTLNWLIVFFFYKILNFRNYLINNFLFTLFYSTKIVNKFFKNAFKKRFFKTKIIIVENTRVSVNQTLIVFIKLIVKSYYFYLNLFLLKFGTKVFKLFVNHYLFIRELSYQIKLIYLTAIFVHLEMFHVILNEVFDKFIYSLEHYILLVFDFADKNFTFLYTNILLLLKPRPYVYNAYFSKSYKLFKLNKFKQYVYTPIKLILNRYYIILLDHTDEFSKAALFYKHLIFFIPILIKKIFLNLFYFFYNSLPNFFFKQILKIWVLIVKIHAKYEKIVIDIKRIYIYCFWSLLIFIMYVFGRGNVYYFKREDTILYIKEVFLWLWFMIYDSYWYIHGKTKIWLFRWLYFSLRIQLKVFKVLCIFDPLRTYKKNIIFFFHLIISFINKNLLKLVMIIIYIFLAYNFFSSIFFVYYVSKIINFLDFFYYIKIISIYYYYKRIRKRFIDYKAWKRMRWRRRRKFLKRLAFLNIMWKFYNKKIYKLRKKKRRRYKVYRKTTLKYELWKIKNQTWTLIKLILRSSWYWFLHSELYLDESYNLFEDYSYYI